jgi:hypothetical protein
VKIFPAFIATTAAFVSMQAAAASYGIDSSQPYYKGASTAETVGSCTIYKSYREAWWGQVKDPSGANIGEGLIAKKRHNRVGVCVGCSVAEHILFGWTEQQRERQVAHRELCGHEQRRYGQCAASFGDQPFLHNRLDASQPAGQNHLHQNTDQARYLHRDIHFVVPLRRCEQSCFKHGG